MAKRKIADVRKELYSLTVGLEHALIRFMHRDTETKEASVIFVQGPHAGMTVAECRIRIDQLKAEYPNWERTRRPKIVEEST